MARLSDVPKVLRSVGPWTLAKRVWHEIQEDNLLTLAAALAYSWLFAIFPFVIFLLGLLPLLPQIAKDKAKDYIYDWVWSWLPPQAADLIWNNTQQLLDLQKPIGSLLSIGLLLSVWGASGGMNMTISALDKCYELDRGRPFYRQRPLAIVLTVVAAALLFGVLLLLPIGSLVIHWLQAHGSQYVYIPLLWLWNILRYPVALLLMFATVNLIYQYGPSIRQRFTYVSPGAVFCVTVWMALGFAFRLYVKNFGKGYNETYGTVGGVAILLLFFYFDAVVLLVGAEINSEIDFEVLQVPRGCRDFRNPQAASVAAPMKEPEPATPPQDEATSSEAFS